MRGFLPWDMGSLSAIGGTAAVLAATVLAAGPAGAASCPAGGVAFGAGTGVEVLRAWATFKPDNPLLKGTAVACGSDVRATFGRSRLRIRAASTAANGDRDSVLYSLKGQQSVIDTMVGSAAGSALDWSLNGSLVRVEAPRETADLGFGLAAGARFFQGRVGAESSFAWVQDGDPGLAAGGLAQRHDIKARLFQFGAGRVTALARFERVEPGYRGQAARRKADRQTRLLGAQLTYRRLRLDIFRESKRDNLNGGGQETNRWDTWRLKSTYDLAGLGLSGVKIALAGEQGGLTRDGGAGFSWAGDRRALGINLSLPQGFAAEVRHKIETKIQGDGTRARGSTSTVQLKWSGPDRAWRTGGAIKLSRWRRPGDGQAGIKVSFGLHTAAKGGEDVRFGLKALAERRSGHADEFAIKARLYFRF